MWLTAELSGQTSRCLCFLSVCNFTTRSLFYRLNREVLFYTLLLFVSLTTEGVGGEHAASSLKTSILTLEWNQWLFCCVLAEGWRMFADNSLLPPCRTGPGVSVLLSHTINPLSEGRSAPGSLIWPLTSADVLWAALRLFAVGDDEHVSSSLVIKSRQ